MGQWFQLPRFVICVLYYWPIHSLHFFDFTFLPYWDNIHHTTTGLSLWIEIIIADRGKCFCSCVTVSWTALNMKVGLEGRTRRIAMVSTFKIWWQNTLVHVFHILGSGSGDGDTFWSWSIYLRRCPLLTKLFIHFINITLNYLNIAKRKPAHIRYFKLWRGVRSDAQLSCTETRFQKCS